MLNFWTKFFLVVTVLAVVPSYAERYDKRAKPVCIALLQFKHYTWPTQTENVKKVMTGILTILHKKNVPIEFEILSRKNRDVFANALKGTPYNGMSGQSFLKKFYQIRGELSWSEFVTQLGFETRETHRRVVFRWPDSEEELLLLLTRVFRVIHKKIGPEGLYRPYLSKHSKEIRELLESEMQVSISGEALCSKVTRMVADSPTMNWKRFLQTLKYEMKPVDAFPWPEKDLDKKELLVKILQYLHGLGIDLAVRSILSQEGSREIQEATTGQNWLPSRKGLTGSRLYADAKKIIPANTARSGFVIAKHMAGIAADELFNVGTQRQYEKDVVKVVFDLSSVGEDDFQTYVRRSGLQVKLIEFSHTLNDYDKMIFDGTLDWFTRHGAIDFKAVAVDIQERARVDVEAQDIERVYMAVSDAMSVARGAE